MLPNDIEASLRMNFHFPEKLLFCQIATQAKDCPNVRTVRLYGIEKDRGLVFITRKTSQKWRELKNNPKMAICFLHPEHQIQLRTKCEVSFLDYGLAPDCAEKYWNMMKEDVKKIYNDQYTPNVAYQGIEQLGVPQKIPDCFGLIVAVPYFWEYLFVDSNYPTSVRYIYTKNSQEEWVRQHLTVA